MKNHKNSEILLQTDDESTPVYKLGRCKKSKIIRIIAIIVVLAILAVAGYIGYTLFATSSKVFNGNPLNALIHKEKELKTDQYGRSNMLFFGTSEDDPGHPGGELSDSIMVVSIDQKKKSAFMISIPRDLNVDYGRVCNSGFQRWKINDVYQCAKTKSGADEQEAQTAFRHKISEVLGLDVQYSVHVNYTALRRMVDAVGGITVLIESDNPKGIYERYVKLPNGPATLNGESALALARARNAEGGFGLSRSNFDREQYQQKILVALKEKAVSAGTLANPLTVNNLLTALGDHVRTNFDTEEMKSLVKMGQTVDSKAISRLDLNTSENPILKSDGNPAAGEYNYHELQAYVKAWATDDISMLEKPTVAVYNATQQSGAAQSKADELADSGFTIKAVESLAETMPGSVALFDQSQGKKPGSLQKLEKLLHSKASTSPPSSVNTKADFIVIITSSKTDE
jgi:LCP family protein required for cell wall assembly